MLIKQKNLLVPRNMALATFDELILVLLKEINLPLLIFSMVSRCCFLHLIKQSYPATPTLHHVPLHLFPPCIQLAHANKTKECLSSKKLISYNFWQVTNCVLNRGKTAILTLLNRGKTVILTLFNGPKGCLLSLTKLSCPQRPLQ